MALIQNSYGKGRVRVMRVHRQGEHNQVRELDVRVMLEGAFAASYTAADNSQVVATDTIKNIVYIVARENIAADTEAFGQLLAQRYLDRYPQVARATVTLHETKWVRAQCGGAPHPHGFVLDANGRPFAIIEATRETATVVSGIDGYTFMKSTQSGWENYVTDEYTTLPPTHDRLSATAMDARWTWSVLPLDPPAANARLLATMIEVFATTYSAGVQDSLYRMAEAALAAVPEVSTIALACPNKHYLPVRLDPFGLSADNMVFIPTDEPHGQIECVVGRT